MDVAERLREPSAGSPVAAEEACARCGERRGALPPVTCFTLGRVEVVRCARCGTRRAVGGPERRLVFTCARCGVPFLADAILPHDEQRCADCRSGKLPPELPTEEIAAATESEIRLALDGRWRCVTAPAVQAYLDRVARLVAARIDGGAEHARVVLVQDALHRTLALPSGTLLVSTGLLSFLEDEAELAFVLGHEIAHAASGDAAVRLSRLGFEASARNRDGDSDDAWAEAAMDLVKLGYGRRRERDADARAVEATLALGYDCDSIGRYLRRAGSAIEAGSAALAETAVAHPPPADRGRRIERALYGRIGADATPKVNREVFRRAVAREELASRLVPTELGAISAAPAGADAEPRGSAWRAAAWTFGLAVAAAVVAGILYLMR